MFRLFSGTLKVVALVFFGLLFADYANQKIAEAQENISNLSWEDIRPQVEEFGTTAYARAKSETHKLVNSFTSKTGPSKRGLEKRAELSHSPFRF